MHDYGGGYSKKSQIFVEKQGDTFLGHIVRPMPSTNTRYITELMNALVLQQTGGTSQTGCPLIHTYIYNIYIYVYLYIYNQGSRPKELRKTRFTLGRTHLPQILNIVGSEMDVGHEIVAALCSRLNDSDVWEQL